MSNLASPIGTTQPYIPVVPAAQVGRYAGLAMHFPTVTDGTGHSDGTGTGLYEAVLTEKANIVASSPIWADKQPFTVATEPEHVRRVWSVASQHAREVVIRPGLSVTLAGDTNTVLTTTGAPSSGTGTNGDIAIDFAGNVVYLKTSGTWSVSVAAIYTASGAVSAAQAKLNKVIAGVTGVYGDVIATHPTVTATFSVGAVNGAWWADPAGKTSWSDDTFFKTYPPYKSSATTASDPSLFTTGPFTTSTVVSQANAATLGPQFWADITVGGGYNMHFPGYNAPALGSISLSAHFSGRYFYFLTNYATYLHSVLLDGKVVGNYTTVGTSASWIQVDFGKVVNGVVTLLTSQIAAIATGVDGTFQALTPTVKASLTADSYMTRPTSTLNAGGGVLYSALAKCGFRDPFNDAHSGTGWLTNAQGGDATFRTRLPAVLAYGPDILIAGGGYNDVYLTSGSDSALQTEINAYFTAARAADANSVIVGFGPWCPTESTAYNASLLTQKINNWVLAALQAVGGNWIFLNLLTGGYQTSAGTSKPGSGRAWQTGDGCKLFFSAALTGATSATLSSTQTVANSSTFQLPSGNYTLIFDDGSQRAVTIANGATTITWTGAVTAGAVAGCVLNTSRGNAYAYVSNEALGHPSQPAGCDYLADLFGSMLRSAILSMRT